jgi:ABC-type Na+ efflux pump permease subunit
MPVSHLVLTAIFGEALAPAAPVHIYSLPLFFPHSLTVLIFYYIPWLAVMYLIDRFLGV